jgi:PadR family transcriptional regulator, regulatory protein PadR
MTRPANASRQTHLLLSTFSSKPREWRHGYELSKETGLTSGTLYPSLMRLHDQGLLESKWVESEVTGRPPRHLYRLTSQGLAFAHRVAAEEPSLVVGRKPKELKA